MASIVLCNISDVVSVIAEEKTKWVHSILEALGVQEDTFKLTNIDEYRNKMEDMGIEVIYYTGGNINIYKKVWHEAKTQEGSGWLPPTDENLVAQWREPEYVKKIEGNEAYYEVHTKEWSILNMRPKDD